ncbi:hypothetical protein BDA96_02G210300 [Sorghum bicolor]|uniref:Uncharacterized protein n=1 Tax=Sorghum bicolor TaxID=4558 RepID=A0A921UTA1_SORBI|nr:hypothetical protein BDA96_02G210300 [Sorghum bicolor]
MGSQELVVRSDPRVVSTGRSCARRRRAACLRGSLPSITSQGRLEREPGEDLRRTALAVAPCRRNDRAQSRSIFSPNIREVVKLQPDYRSRLLICLFMSTSIEGVFVRWSSSGDSSYGYGEIERTAPVWSADISPSQRAAVKVVHYWFSLNKSC